MSKTTKPLGKGTRNLTANVPNALYAGIARLASVSGCRIGEFVRALLEDAVAGKVLVRRNPESEGGYFAALNAGIRPLPKVVLEVFRPVPAQTPAEKYETLRVAEGGPKTRRR